MSRRGIKLEERSVRTVSTSTTPDTTMRILHDTIIPIVEDAERLTIWNG